MCALCVASFQASLKFHFYCHCRFLRFYSCFRTASFPPKATYSYYLQQALLYTLIRLILFAASGTHVEFICVQGQHA